MTLNLPASSPSGEGKLNHDTSHQYTLCNRMTSTKEDIRLWKSCTVQDRDVGQTDIPIQSAATLSVGHLWASTNLPYKYTPHSPPSHESNS